MVLLKTLESPLDCKEIKSINIKENQPSIFTGKSEAEAEASILWPANGKSLLAGKDPDAGERLRARGEGNNRGSNDWMPSLTQWT